GEQVGVGHAAGEGDVLGDAQLARQGLHLVQGRTAADQAEVDIRSLKINNQGLYRLQQQVDALLPPHYADVADEVFLPLLQVLLGRHDLQALEARAAAHHEHALGRHAATLDGDAAVRIVGGDGDVGEAEGEPLEQAHRLPEQVAPAELGLVQLGVGVVVVEHELLAEQLEEVADEEEQVRGIARVDHVEAPAEQHTPAQQEGPEQGSAVFDRIAQRALGFRRQLIAPDVDAVDLLVLLLVALAGRADDRHQVPRVAQGGGLLPYPPVERTRQVLDQDENTAFHLLDGRDADRLQQQGKQGDAHHGEAGGEQALAHLGNRLQRGEKVLAAARQAAVHALQVLGPGIGLQAVDEVAAPRDVDRRLGHRDAHAVASHEPQVARRAPALRELAGNVDRVHALDVARGAQRQRLVGAADLHEHGAR